MSFWDYTPVGAKHGGEVKFFDGYHLGLKGALARAAEEARQGIMQDYAYTANYPYALSIQTPKDFLKGQPGTKAVFAFPLGPQSVELTRPFKQRVVTTIGGIYAQEAGYNAWKLKVEGNFGLTPKSGYDSTDILNVAYEKENLPIVSGMQALSGPKWTMRLIQHMFDRYAALKANPKYNAQTYMTWHNFKDDEHLVVVPTVVGLHRSVNSRMMYPFSLEFEVIGHADSIEAPDKESLISSILGYISMASVMAKTAVNLADDALNTINALAGKARGVVARIDGMQDDWSQINDKWVYAFGGELSDGTVVEEGSTSWGSWDGLATTIRSDNEEARKQLKAAIEKNAADETFVASAWTRTDALAEINQAINQMDDAVDAVGMHGADAQNTNDEANDNIDNHNQAEGSANTDPSAPANTQPTPSSLPSSTDLGDFEVTGDNTLPGIAEALLGDAALWKVLAVINKLRAPYISSTGMPGTVKPGDTIKVPISGTKDSIQVMGWQHLAGSDSWGCDILLKEAKGSGVGRPAVDIAIDRSTGRDIKLSKGKTNLLQAVQMRVWTTMGTMKLFPRYGLPVVVGTNIPAYSGRALQLSVRSALLEDSRIASVGRTTTTTIDDVIEVDAEVIPINLQRSLSIPVSVI